MNNTIRNVGLGIKTIVRWSSEVLLVIIFLNICAYLILPHLPDRNRDLATYLSKDKTNISADLYSEMPKGYLVDVLTDLVTYFQSGVSYFPHSEYCESPFRSQTFNILTDPTGLTYRSGYEDCFKHGDTMIDRIYVFGGSTSVGIFVGDKETWPSQLHRILKKRGKNIEVVNYAVSGHSVTEEFLRFYDLVKLGHRPSMIVVLDGLNLGLEADQSKFSNAFAARIKTAQQGESPGQISRSILVQLPLTKVVMRLLPASTLKMFFVNQVSADVSMSPLESYSDSTVVRYQTNRFNNGISDFEWLCGKYGIKFLYCLQPNAFYNYNMDSCTACGENPNKHYKEDVGSIYASIRSTHPEVLDLTGLFDKYHKKAIVDDTHYSVGFNSYLADEIARGIDIDSLHTAAIYTNMATGGRFTFFDQ